MASVFDGVVVYILPPWYAYTIVTQYTVYTRIQVEVQGSNNSVIGLDNHNRSSVICTCWHLLEASQDIIKTRNFKIEF